MAQGTLSYVSLIDGHTKKFSKTNSDSLRLLDGLKKDFRALLISNYACNHGAEIFVFEECKTVFHYVYNNGSWRDKTSIFSNGNYR